MYIVIRDSEVQLNDVVAISIGAIYKWNHISYHSAHWSGLGTTVMHSNWLKSNSSQQSFSKIDSVLLIIPTLAPAGIESPHAGGGLRYRD